MPLSIDIASSRPSAAPLLRGVLSSHWVTFAGIFGIALLMRHLVAANTDVSWLLIAAERLLDGHRLYVDILETNPPMAVLVYVPGVLIGRALGFPAEIVTDALVFTAIAVSLALVVRILRQSSVGARLAGGPFVVLAAAVLAILPTQAFAQREHIAVIELLPVLAVFAMRIRGERPPSWTVIVAGIGLGLALSFKPYFAIAMFCCVVPLTVQARNWWLLVAPEFLIAALLIGVYGIGTVLLFPDYVTIVGPIARDVYVPIGLSMAEMLGKPVVPLWGIALIATMWLMRKSIDAAGLLLLATSLGFGVIFFLQRKGWPYHSYPMMAFALLALGCAIQSSSARAGAGQRGLVIGASLLLAGLFVPSMIWFDRAFDARPLQAAVARLGSHPRVLAISGEAGIGHPLTRAVGGTWVSRQQMLLVSGYDRYLRQQGSPDAKTIAMMDGYVARERAWLIDDISKLPPTVVLVDRLTADWDVWMRASPELIDLVRDFRLAETVMDVDIYVRRTD